MWHIFFYKKKSYKNKYNKKKFRKNFILPTFCQIYKLYNNNSSSNKKIKSSLFYLFSVSIQFFTFKADTEEKNLYKITKRKTKSNQNCCCVVLVYKEQTKTVSGYLCSGKKNYFHFLYPNNTTTFTYIYTLTYTLKRSRVTYMCS